MTEKNIRSAIRRVLLQEQDSFSPPPEITDGTTTYTYVGLASSERVGPRSSPKYIYKEKGKANASPVEYTQSEIEALPSAPTAAPVAIPATASPTATPATSTPTTKPTPKNTGERGFKKLSETVNAIAGALGEGEVRLPAANIRFSISDSAREVDGPNISFSAAVDSPNSNFVGALWAVCNNLGEKVAAKSEKSIAKTLLDTAKNALGFESPSTADLSTVFNKAAWDTMLGSLRDMKNESSPPKVAPILTAYHTDWPSDGNLIPTNARDNPDNFAKYITFLYNAVKESDKPSLLDTFQAALPSLPGAGGSVPEPTPAPAPSEPKAILKFLSDKVDLYFSKVTGFSSPQDLVEAINKGNTFGPAAGKALGALIAVIQEKAPSSRQLYADYPGKPEKLNDIKDSKSETDLSKWRGAGETFPAGTQGLIDFLRFSYAAASGPDADDVKRAAAKMGIIENNQFFPLDRLWRELCFSGALSPFPFFVILGPESDRIPKNAKIYIEPNVTSGPIPTSATEVPRTFIKVKDLVRDYPRGIVLCVGRSTDDSTEVAGYTITPDIFGEDAKRFIDARGKQVRIVMEIDKQAYVVIVNLEFGAVVDFKSLAQKPAPQGKSGASLAREVSKMISTPGRTIAGTTTPFTFENVYIKSNGTFDVRNEEVVLQKRVPIGGGDEFELRVTNPQYNYILVPVRLETAAGPARLSEARSLISEQAAHWVVNYSRSRQQVSPGPSGAAVGFLAVSSLSWKTNRNQRLYGPGGIDITRVNYTPTAISRDQLPEDVNIITPEQAMRLGQKGQGLNPIEYAISMYVASNENPLGTPLYLAKSINRPINNDFPPASVAAGGYN